MADVQVPTPDISVPKVKDKEANPVFMVRFKGTVDFDGLYSLIYGWLKERQFKIYETTHKFKPPEIEIKLECNRKKTAYKRDVVVVNIHLFKIRDLEVKSGDGTKKLMEVRMKIKFSSMVETGYSNIFGWSRWGVSKGAMVLQNILNRYILKKEIDLVDSDAIYYELYDLQKRVKDFLGMAAKGSAY